MYFAVKGSICDIHFAVTESICVIQTYSLSIHEYFLFKLTQPETVLLEVKADFSKGRVVISGHHLYAQKEHGSGLEQNGINDIE